ncbi:glycosyltransferase [bacterium]|nr:glycosyltransferase [bacterium]
MTFLTVFTPTYNRAHTLPDVYRSLAEQTDKDFLWLIVDDGSTDETAAQVARWQSEGLVPIRYVFQENAGKHFAFNRAIEIADSELFECLDSDDMLKPRCVERLKYHWRRMRSENSQAKAICFLLSDSDGGEWNEDFSEDEFEAYFAEKVCDGTLRADVWLAFDTEAIKRHRYLEKWRKIYFPDAMMPYAVSADAKVRFVNERLGIYRWNPADAERLSNFSRPENLRRGGALSLFLGNWIRLNYAGRLIRKYPVYHLKLATQYDRFADLANISLKERIRMLDRKDARLLAVLTLIPGRLASWLTVLKHRRELNAKPRAD